MNLLSILRDGPPLFIVHAVETHPPASSAVIGGRDREKDSNSFVNTIVWSVLALSMLSGCALFAPREEVQLKQATLW